MHLLLRQFSFFQSWIIWLSSSVFKSVVNIFCLAVTLR